MEGDAGSKVGHRVLVENLNRFQNSYFKCICFFFWFCLSVPTFDIFQLVCRANCSEDYKVCNAWQMSWHSPFMLMVNKLCLQIILIHACFGYEFRERSEQPSLPRPRDPLWYRNSVHFSHEGEEEQGGRRWMSLSGWRDLWWRGSIPLLTVESPPIRYVRCITYGYLRQYVCI